MAFQCGPTTIRETPGSPLMMNYTNSDHHGRNNMPGNANSSSSHHRRHSTSSRQHRHEDDDDDEYYDDDRRDDSIFYDDDDHCDDKDLKKTGQQRRHSHLNRSHSSTNNRQYRQYEDASNLATMDTNISNKDKNQQTNRRRSGSSGNIHSNPPTGGGTGLNHDEVLEVDYDKGATPLYRYIENKKWEYAMQQLHDVPEDARTWVSRKDLSVDAVNRTRWKLLPIHAVCIFRAPLSFMEQLIASYPDGTKMKDDQGMLPIHLACRNGASLNVIMLLLKSYPISVYIRDRKQRSIYDLISMKNSTGNNSSPTKNKENLLHAIQQFQDDMENGNIALSNTVNSKTNMNHYNKGSAPKDDENELKINNENHHENPKRRKSISTSSVISASKELTGGNNKTTDQITALNMNGNLSNKNKTLKENHSHSRSQSSIKNPGNTLKSGNQEVLYVDGITNVTPSSTQNASGIIPTVLPSSGTAPPLVSSLMVDQQPKTLLQRVGGSAGNTMMTPTGSLVALTPMHHMMDMYNEVEVDYDHRTTLFRLLLKKDWDNVIQRCNEYPNEAQTWIVTKGFNGSLRFLPIHKACVLQPPLSVIQSLLQVYPMGSIKTDQDGWLPIHCAAFYGTYKGISIH
jgi:hypothetical protein